MLISGKEAKLAWANDEDVEYMPLNQWQKLNGVQPLSIFNREDVKFRLKPRTISINGIEVPAPFEPKEGEPLYHIYTDFPCGYSCSTANEENRNTFFSIGAWRTEDEIKQVVEALRSVFK